MTTSAKFTPSRREAIRSGGAFLAGLAMPALLPSSSRAVGEAAPSNKIGVGFIGVGGMGGSNLGSFLGEDSCRVLAVCDVKRQSREHARNQVNQRYKGQGCQAYADFRELLARPDIDVVVISTPDHWHGVIAVAAAIAGKDIYGEKPLAHTFRENRRVVDAVHRYGRVWQTGSWQRSQHNFPRGCELVRNGRIGKVHTIEVGLPVDGTSGRNQPYEKHEVPDGLDYNFWVGPSRWMPYHPQLASFNWRWNLNFGGGALMDWIGHHLDIANWGMGWRDLPGPMEIEGWGRFMEQGLYDAAHKFRVTMKYPGGIKVILSGNDGIANGTKWIGDKGWVRVDRGVIQAGPSSLLNEQLGPGELVYPRSRGHTYDFLSCVRSRAETLTPVLAAHAASAPGHLAHIAMTLGRKIQFDPASNQVIGDDTANAMLGCALRAPWTL